MKRLFPCFAIMLSAAPSGLEPVPWAEVPAVELGDLEGLREGLRRSLAGLRAPSAVRRLEGWDPSWLPRLVRSLETLEALLEAPPADLRAALEQAFVPHRLRGVGGYGVLHLTGYCEAWAEGSRHRRGAFRYPLYRRPRDLGRWPKPHPTRLELEGRTGTGSERLKGLELVWMRDRMAAYLFHVQGSGRVALEEGGELALTFAGRTEHPFVAVGDLLTRELAAAGRNVPPGGVYAHLRANPDLMASILPRNPRFIFFSEAPAGPPPGAYGMGVLPGRSFAADPAWVPPGALTLLQGSFGTRLAFNQDRGGAIQGPGRLDLYEGGGPEAMARAGAINGPGRAWVLLAR